MHRLNEVKFLSTVKFIRTYVTKTKNLYEILGLGISATQADIKSAYYKLSKVYHPDMNKNDKVASEKFRQLKEAYEVLGNYRLRKLYDKGIIHTAGSDFAHHARPAQRTQAYNMEEDFNDDASTKFYKSRLRREHTGQSRVYDFDEWTKEHYGSTFRTQQATKIRRENRRVREEKFIDVKASRSTLFYMLVVLACFGIIGEHITQNFHDIVDPNIKHRIKNNNDEDQKESKK